MTRHRFDTFSFLVGAVAVAIGAVVLSGSVTIQLIDLRVAGPVLLLALGLALLVGGGRRQGADEDAGPDGVPTHDADDTVVSGQPTWLDDPEATGSSAP